MKAPKCSEKFSSSYNLFTDVLRNQNASFKAENLRTVTMLGGAASRYPAATGTLSLHYIFGTNDFGYNQILAVIPSWSTNIYDVKTDVINGAQPLPLDLECGLRHRKHLVLDGFKALIKNVYS